MKNILIGGPARSGESIFASLLSRKLGYNVFRGGLIMSALLITHPEVAIDKNPNFQEILTY